MVVPFGQSLQRLVSKRHNLSIRTQCQIIEHMQLLGNRAHYSWKLFQQQVFLLSSGHQKVKEA